MKPPIDAMQITGKAGGKKFDPNADLGPHEKNGLYIGRALAEHFDLTHFGIYMDILEPASRSSVRHWHTNSDEFVMMLEGELVLVTDESETTMTPCMVAGFKAGDENGHHLINRSEAAARFMVVGSRMPGDKVHYPDDDLQWMEKDGKWVAAHKDGTVY